MNKAFLLFLLSGTHGPHLASRGVGVRVSLLSYLQSLRWHIVYPLLFFWAQSVQPSNIFGTCFCSSPCLSPNYIKDILYTNMTEAWLKLPLLPKCVPTFFLRGVKTNKHVGVNLLCEAWSFRQYASLLSHAVNATAHHTYVKVHKQNDSMLRVASAISLECDGLYSKAFQTLTLSGIDIKSEKTWRLLIAKHLKISTPEFPLLLHYSGSHFSQSLISLRLTIWHSIQHHIGMLLKYKHCHHQSVHCSWV